MTPLVEAARKYLCARTPFRHRGRDKHGLDCAGLIVIAYKDCGVDIHDSTHYGREPANDGLVQHAIKAFGYPIAFAPVKAEDMQPGDVILRRYVKEAHHGAIITDYPYGGLGIIHCDGHHNRVVEHRLDDDLIGYITHVFRRPV